MSHVLCLLTQMSRLDRLVLLLDTGSSAFVRNTAADQLADVQKSHPEELFNLLGRVFPFLKSKNGTHELRRLVPLEAL